MKTINGNEIVYSTLTTVKILNYSKYTNIFLNYRSMKFALAAYYLSERTIKFFSIL